MTSLSIDIQADVMRAFNSKSRYVDYLHNIDSHYLKSLVKQIYPPELQMYEANTSDTEASFTELHLSISN